MQTGLTLAELAAKPDAQAASKKDYIAPTKRTEMAVRDEGIKLVLEDQGEFPIRLLAGRQLATFTDIPQKYFDRMQSDALALPPSVLTIRDLSLFCSQRLTLVASKSGAYLSNSYQRIDHIDIAKVALPVLHYLPQVQIVSAQVTDSKLYLHFTVPTIQGEVKVNDTFRLVASFPTQKLAWAPTASPV